jgi:hypothetical protein
MFCLHHPVPAWATLFEVAAIVGRYVTLARNSNLLGHDSGAPDHLHTRGITAFQITVSFAMLRNQVTEFLKEFPQNGAKNKMVPGAEINAGNRIAS